MPSFVNPISAFAVRATSFDGPELDADGNPTSALGQVLHVNPLAHVLDIIETGSYLTWLVTGTNSFTLPAKPAAWSDADWQLMLSLFANWYNFSIDFAQTNQISLIALESEVSHLLAAKQAAYRYKIYDSVLALLAKRAGL